jgi:hypothetical protein
VDPARPPRWAALVVGLGLYVTCRGYHSLDGDQAYRLPLLLHQQDGRLYRDDPFVRAFDAFNPHRGFLAVLDLASRPFGLAAGLAGLFAASFCATAIGVERLARAVWPDAGRGVGWVAVALVLAAKAGNIGTNHLFEAMLLDRLLALGLGWLALAELVVRPDRAAWTGPALLGAAAFVHPSVGLQLSLWFAATCGISAAFLPRDERSRGRDLLTLALVGLAVAPALAPVLAESGRLWAGLEPGEYAVLTAQIQSPQHMLPHLWRMPQWLAAACYPVLGGLALTSWRPWSPSRRRLAVLIAGNLAWLVAAWVAVEILHNLRVTVFQPFRMATPARGLCLVLLAGHLERLWVSRGNFGRPRAALLAVGLTGDWSLVAATGVELATAIGALGGRRFAFFLGSGTLAAVLAYLACHDPEAGQVRLLAALAFGQLATFPMPFRGLRWGRARLARLLAAAWAVPTAALFVQLVDVEVTSGWMRRLVEHCRFVERPIDDVERLALWCRSHTPEDARFIGPPGPKTFRLWSRRALAFNRAASPYHAAGLGDWAARFRDHVGFDGSLAEFAAAYLHDRQGLERRYDALTAAELADLASRQDAGFVLASSGLAAGARGPLEFLHAEGDYAIYCVRERATPEGSASTSLAGSGAAASR